MSQSSLYEDRGHHIDDPGQEGGDGEREEDAGDSGHAEEGVVAEDAVVQLKTSI